MAGAHQPVREAAPLRDLALFACGPALLTIAIALAFAAHPWPVPVEGQARAMTPLFYGPILSLGALGVWLSSRAGLASAPSLTDGRRWLELLLVSAAFGLFFSITSIASDIWIGLAKIGAEAIGQSSMNVAGAIIVPRLGHLIGPRRRHA